MATTHKKTEEKAQDETDNSKHDEEEESEVDLNMPCGIHRGERGGRYYLKRKRGGGTKRVYLKKGERKPT